MAAQVLANDDPVRCRVLRGRTIKVTVCDADPEFTSKVARIQDEIISKSNMSVVEDEQIVQETTPAVPSVSKVDENVVQENTAVLPSASSETSVIEADGGCFGKPAKKIEVGQDADEDVSASTLIPKASVDSVSETDKPISVDSGYDQSSQSDILQEGYDGNQSTESEIVMGDDAKIVGVHSTPDQAVEQAEVQGELLDSHQMPQNNQMDLQLDESLESLSPDHGTGLSVFNRVDLKMYSEYEWKGSTPKAEQMRQGYLRIIDVTSQPSMRKIRGDNYCGIRATCFQVLSQKLNALKLWKPDFSEVVNIPQKLMHNHRCNWLTQWSFAGRLKVTPKKRLDTLKQCLELFCSELTVAQSIPSLDDRVDYFLNYFNSGKPDEVLLFEAMKLLMLHSAVMLHESMTKGDDVPVFAWLLFARDTSENPEQLMLNHLNAVGDSGGLEQVEMFLLGHALNITIRVVRPSQVGQEDFVTHYPDDHLDDWDTCDLIAEDDRHYNIVVP